MKLIVHGRPGARKKVHLLERLPVIVEELGVATPERIRQRYRVKYNEPVGWNTIVRYLRRLVSEGLIQEECVTSGKNRHTVLYRIRC